jgi:hypothetical protein
VSQDPCRDECERLVAIGEDMRRVHGDGWPELHAWQERAAALLARPDLASRAGEQAVHALANELRACWMALAHRCSDLLYKSPPLAEPKRLPRGQSVEFSYERNIRPTALEERCRGYRPAGDGWEAEHVLYASGMAGLASTLQALLGMARAAAGDPFRVAIWGEYFETHVLLELMRGAGLQWQRVGTQEELQAIVREGRADLVLIEPVRYDWDLHVFDVRGFLQAWQARQGSRPGMLLLDTTLVGPTFPVLRLLEALRAAPPAVVFQLGSGLKLDQQGLELSNVGVMTVYTAQQRSSGPGAAELAGLLRKMRTIQGTGLSMDEMCLLDAPFFLDPAQFAEYSQAVFRNNALLAHALAGESGLFARVVHPSLSAQSRQPWAQAPFVVFHLYEDTLATHGHLLAIVAHEARERDLCLHLGSSFGFRGHRFEVILPRLSDKRGLFKVAMGARPGPSRDGVIELFLELAALPDAAALRARWPHVAPVDLKGIRE